MTCHDSLFFFFNHTATTEIYTLSLHDALPIWLTLRRSDSISASASARASASSAVGSSVSSANSRRSEEHTSELQSRLHLVCRLLLEKKKNTASRTTHRQICAGQTPQSQQHTFR